MKAIEARKKYGIPYNRADMIHAAEGLGLKTRWYERMFICLFIRRIEANIDEVNEPGKTLIQKYGKSDGHDHDRLDQAAYLSTMNDISIEKAFIGLINLENKKLIELGNNSEH